MQSPASDLATGFAAWTEARRRELSTELDALRERTAAIEAELERFDGAQALMAEYLADGRATAAQTEQIDRSPGVAAGAGPTITPATPAPPPPDTGSQPHGSSAGTLAQRIARIAVQQPDRTWTSRDFTNLLFGAGGAQERARQETVRKTLQRMARRGHMRRDGASLYGATDRTGEALKG